MNAYRWRVVALGELLLVTVIVASGLDAYAIGIALCTNFIGYMQGYELADSRAGEHR